MPILAEMDFMAAVVTAIVIPLLGAVAFFLGRVWPLLMGWSKQRHAHDLEDEEAKARREAARLELEEEVRREAHAQVTAEYKEELALLRADRVRQGARVESLFTEIRGLVQAHAECLVKNEKLAARVSVLEATLEQVTVTQSAARMPTRTEAIAIVDEDRVVRSWNEAATALLHWQPHEAVGRSYDFLVPPEEKARERFVWDEIMASGEDPPRGPHLTAVLDRDGHLIPVEVTLSGWREEHGGRTRRMFAASARRRLTDAQGVAAEEATDPGKLRAEGYSSPATREAQAGHEPANVHVSLPPGGTVEVTADPRREGPAEGGEKPPGGC